MLQILADSSLLERWESDECVKMHDVVRDMVLRMTSPNGEECTYLVRAGSSNFEEMPEDKEWESTTRISFMYNKLGSLPESPVCPMLLTLPLQGNYELEVIPKSFFNHMPSLGVLDLSRTRIKTLPTSISNLVSLRALLLKGCEFLEALPEELSALKELEVLWVTRTKMACLPSRIWELINLKCGKFSSFYGGGDEKMIINSGRLSQMEELSILEFGSSLLSDGSVDIVTKELGYMTRLSSLGFGFRRVNNLQYFLQNSKPWRDGKLTKFRFSVGEHSWNYSQCLYYDFKGRKRCLRYKARGGDGISSSIIIPDAVKEVLACSDCLVLEGHEKLKNLSDLGARNTFWLKTCCIYECGELETIRSFGYFSEFTSPPAGFTLEFEVHYGDGGNGITKQQLHKSEGIGLIPLLED
uniref:Disease resistance R13L4/SHOC-2-like LRR domain-containing protein n=1 Tax=Davidia involucrata TaxID=16924 RepID=A0A5B6YKG0_DAVIN